MPLTSLDPTPALVVIDLQKGIVSGSVAHAVPGAEGAPHHARPRRDGIRTVRQCGRLAKS
jgi:nicotinamidase-related amidase